MVQNCTSNKHLFNFKHGKLVSSGEIFYISYIGYFGYGMYLKCFSLAFKWRIKVEPDLQAARRLFLLFLH